MAPAAEILRDPQDALVDPGAIIIDLNDVALRRERLAAYVEATRAVIVYRFVFPSGASIAAVGGGEPRDVRAQLELAVAMTGGALAKSYGGLAARIPKSLTARSRHWLAPRLRPISCPSTLVRLDRAKVQSLRHGCERSGFSRVVFSWCKECDDGARQGSPDD